MLRKIIHIDQDKCNGCTLCVTACHEGAITMIAGKATLMREDYCDGLGDCLPVCPTGAITFEEREAAEYDEAAVKAAMQAKHQPANSFGCPGMQAKTLSHTQAASAPESTAPAPSQLNQWPVQIKLVPTQAPYFQGAHLLIAADCCAYAYGSFHSDYMRGKITIIGCPKLDAVEYTQKLTELLQSNQIKSVTLTRMEVPCCGGLEQALKGALQACGKLIPWQVVTFTTDGRILAD